jgi:hypothetical protein
MLPIILISKSGHEIISQQYQTRRGVGGPNIPKNPYFFLGLKIPNFPTFFKFPPKNPSFSNGRPRPMWQEVLDVVWQAASRQLTSCCTCCGRNRKIVDIAGTERSLIRRAYLDQQWRTHYVVGERIQYFVATFITWSC